MKNNSRLIETRACMQELDDPKYEAASGAWLLGVSMGDPNEPPRQTGFGKAYAARRRAPKSETRKEVATITAKPEDMDWLPDPDGYLENGKPVFLGSAHETEKIVR